MTAPTCATCKHFRLSRLVGDVPSSFGTCWRYPPQRDDAEVTIRDACGEHSPAGPAAAPPLPAGWEWDEVEYGTRAYRPNDTRCYVTVYTSGAVEAFGAPLDAVDAVAQAHRARASGR